MLELYALPALSLTDAPGAAVLHLSSYDARHPLQGFAWLFRAGRDWALIDTGADDLETINASRPVSNRWQAHPISDLLGRFHLTPSDIRHVVLTHLHWDHVGNLGLFLDATWYVPEAEWSFVGNPANRDVLPEILYPQNTIELLRSKGMRTLFHGEMPVPQLRLRHLGGHSPGCAAMDILDDQGNLRLVLGGDVIPLYENLNRQIPPGTLWSYPDCIRALKQLKRLSHAGIPVLPGHDPLILKHYPSGIVLNE